MVCGTQQRRGGRRHTIWKNAPHEVCSGYPGKIARYIIAGHTKQGDAKGTALWNTPLLKDGARESSAYPDPGDVILQEDSDEPKITS